MTRFFRVAVLALVVVGVVATPAAAAQNTTNTTGDGNGSASAVIQVGSVVTVTDYEYSDGEFEVTLRSEIPSLVTISDVLGPVQDAGATAIPQKRVTVGQGETTVSMEVGTYRGSAAISIATSDGAIYLSTGIEPPNPWAGTSPALGWFGGAGVGLSMFGLAAWRKKHKLEDAPERAGES